jgi:hypothetical protein
LRLPADLYRNFIERFFSSSELLEARKVEEKLRRTFLFSDAVTNTTLFSLRSNCTITACTPVKASSAIRRATASGRQRARGHG